MKRLLIIPARGKSKRIPNKNIKSFCGKPIISYVLSNAKKSKLFSKIHISTDSNKIKKKVQSLGYKIDFKRPANLSTDKIPVISVLKFVLRKFKKINFEFDEVWTASACSPLLTISDFRRASRISKKLKNKVLLAVTRFGAPVEWAFKKKIKNQLVPVYKKKIFTRSQNLEHSFYDAGSFAVFPKNLLLKRKINLKDKFVGFELPPHRAVDIDDLANWKFAEFLFKARSK